MRISENCVVWEKTASFQSVSIYAPVVPATPEPPSGRPHQAHTCTPMVWVHLHAF